MNTRLESSTPASRLRRRMVIFVLLLAVAAGGWVVFSGTGEKTLPASTIAMVTRGDIEETVTAQGKLEPKFFVDVGAQVSGQLQRVHVEIGDTVKKGQLMAEIDPRVYGAQVEINAARLQSLRAQILQQQAQLVLAKQVYARNLGLIKLKAVSKEALETSRAERDAAVAKLASLTAQSEEAMSALKAAKTNLSYTKIYAPIQGTVTSQTTRQGQTINANQTAPNIMQVANLDVMTVRAQVAEADVSRITAGMAVYFTTLGGGEHRWKGTVRQVLPTPVTINDVVLYEALVDVENPDHALMTGMSTQMFFLLRQSEQVLLVPAGALRKPVPAEDTPMGKAYRIVLNKKGRAHEKTVLVGIVTRTQAEIVAGLSEGDNVEVPVVVPTKKPLTMPMGPRL